MSYFLYASFTLIGLNLTSSMLVFLEYHNDNGLCWLQLLHGADVAFLFSKVFLKEKHTLNSLFHPLVCASVWISTTSNAQVVFCKLLYQLLCPVVGSCQLIYQFLCPLSYQLYVPVLITQPLPACYPYKVFFKPYLIDYAREEKVTFSNKRIRSLLSVAGPSMASRVRIVIPQ